MVGLAHIILSMKTINPLITSRKRIFNFWVFDKSNKEVSISKPNSAWLCQNYLSLIASTEWWAVGVV
jgi:hypothetical protein